MSVARITNVSKSRKPGTCSKCGTDLPVGSAYLWYTVGFRSHRKTVRCTDAKCFPRESERESSLLAGVYAAREDAEDQVDGVTTVDEAREILSTYADAIREVAAEYEAAKEDENGNVFNLTAEERQEALESAADEVEDFDLDEDTSADCEACSGDGEVECDTCGGTGFGLDDDDNEVECTDCDGSGKVECEEDDCEDGQVPDLDALRSSLGDALQTDLGC